MNPFDLLKNVALRQLATSLVRHGLNALGAVLVTRGLASQDDWASIALQASPIIISYVWSLIEKSQTTKVAETREAVALLLPAGAVTSDVTAAIAKDGTVVKKAERVMAKAAETASPRD